MKLPRTHGLLIALILLQPVVGTTQDVDYSGLSGPQMVSSADDALSAMESTLSSAEELRSRTEGSDGDIARLRCINDKIASIQGFIRLAQGAQSALGDRIRANDRDGMEHQYTMLSISRGRVQNLLSEANQCAGEMLTFSGEGGAEATVDDDIPGEDEDLTTNDDPQTNLENLAPDDPLPEATPFQ